MRLCVHLFLTCPPRTKFFRVCEDVECIASIAYTSFAIILNSNEIIKEWISILSSDCMRLSTFSRTTFRCVRSFCDVSLVSFHSLVFFLMAAHQCLCWILSFFSSADHKCFPQTLSFSFIPQLNFRIAMCSVCTRPLFSLPFLGVGEWVGVLKMSFIRVSLSALFVHKENGNYCAMNSYLNAQTNELGKTTNVIDKHSVRKCACRLRNVCKLWCLMWFDVTNKRWVWRRCVHILSNSKRKNSARCE